MDLVKKGQNKMEATKGIRKEYNNKKKTFFKKSLNDCCFPTWLGWSFKKASGVF